MTHAIATISRRTILKGLGAAALCPRMASAADLAQLSGRAFGTSWRILAVPDAGLESLRGEIDALFARIDRQMSPWRPDSTLSRFNAGTSGWHEAEADLVHVTRAALATAKASDGSFDPTVGPLVARWGFGPIEGGAPEWHGLHAEDGRIGKTHDDLTLDLCGIAKGYALDRAAGIVADAGLGDALLELGGEFRALGRHPAGRAWRVAVENPTPGDPPPAALRLPPGAAVATSGIAAQSYTLAGRTFGHIIDPASRTPAAGHLASVTVMARNAMTTDGWATALFAAGETRGPGLARSRGIDALFLVRDGTALTRATTGNIAQSLL